MMSTQRSFKSIEATLFEFQLERGLNEQAVAELFADNLNKMRDQQEIFHFESDKGTLGPGRLIGLDIKERIVHIQLLGESEVRKYSFSQISDFGHAKYNNPTNMGELLMGAYWEAKSTRRYLERIVANSYACLAPEEIDSFARIEEISPSDVSDLIPLELPESEIKSHLCKILGNPFIPKDWGGEASDIFCTIKFRRKTVPAAFVLKGKAYAHKPLRIADLGKNGDQLVRMFSLQAKIFVVQSNGPVDGTVYNHIQCQVAEKLMTAQPVYYLVLDGVQTARLLRAYNML